MKSEFTRIGFARSVVLPALLLFLIPILGYGFGEYAIDSYDDDTLANVRSAVVADESIPEADRAQVIAVYASNPPSVACFGDAEAQAVLSPDFIANVCGDYAQFGWIGQASVGSIALGLFSLVFVLICTGFAFRSREAQHLSFMAGWNVLRIASLLQVLAQGFIAVMLSFWVTAFFFNLYSIKLIAILGIGAAVAAWLVIVAIFRRPPDDFAVTGTPITPAKSPALWRRIEAICQRLETAPPDHILGGIDDNFFVTEHDVQVGDQTLRGRTLYLSLSLLKRLDKPEAEAILAHEMAHFSGGDTAYSKKLAPMLARYGQYLQALYDSVLARPIFYFMVFYRTVFELALGQHSRDRELRADRLSADVTSPDAAVGALLKVSAYSAYRQRIEQGMFEQDQVHAELGIAQRIAAGFTDYASGEHLSDDLGGARFPHPFDSHPPLGERMANVGVEIDANRYRDVVTAPASETWFTEIGDADAIEAELWARYEQGFQAVHELSLAYRYLPSTPEEQALVERVFPRVELPGKDGTTALIIDHATVEFTGWETPLRWLDLEQISVEDKMLGDVLKLVPESGAARTIPLKAIRTSRDHLLGVVQHYFGRAMTAKAQGANST